MSRAIPVTAALVLAGVSCCHPAPPVVEPLVVTVYADDSPEAAATPCGKACANLATIGCSDGKPAPGEPSCYRACSRMNLIAKVPLACWQTAPSVPAARACGGVRCLP